MAQFGAKRPRFAPVATTPAGALPTYTYENAVTIGMFPDIPLENFHYIGNSSQAGAYAMLLSSEAREKVFELGRSMTYLELSNEPGYMDEFVAACFLPHTDSSLFPSVSQE